MDTIRIEEILNLSVAERIDLMEMIWDSIAVSQVERPLTEAQIAELERRVQAHAKNPEDAKSWDEVKAKISQRK